MSQDTFAVIAVAAPAPTNPPTDAEGGTGSGGPYCVVAQKPTDTPVNEEGGTGSGGPYCVIA